MRKLLLCLLVLLCTMLCGCLNENPESLSLGKYELENAIGVTTPYVLLKKNREFVFESSNSDSYSAYGTYEIKNNTLILTTDDKAYTFVFKIYDGSVLCFDLKQSSKISEYNGKFSIKAGARYVIKMPYSLGLRN